MTTYQYLHQRFPRLTRFLDYPEVAFAIGLGLWTYGCYLLFGDHKVGYVLLVEAMLPFVYVLLGWSKASKPSAEPEGSSE